MCIYKFTQFIVRKKKRDFLFLTFLVKKGVIRFSSFVAIN